MSNSASAINRSAHRNRSIAVIPGARSGHGGLGLQSGTAVASLVRDGYSLRVFGRAQPSVWPRQLQSNISWSATSEMPRDLWARYSCLRWNQGRLQYQRDVHMGRWAASQIAQARPETCYAFTQVALETMQWAVSRGTPVVLETPNGHIANFREVCERESRDLCGCRFRGHPTRAMVKRVMQEYRLATAIRVSSDWARRSLVAGGVPAERIYVCPQPVDLQRFKPAEQRASLDKPLQICFVGSLDLRKGFVYLLRAIRRVGAQNVSLRIVGATGDRCSRRLFAIESQGLTVTAAAGDPAPAYHASELVVVPSLEDGSPFVVGEALASGCPVVVTDQCGNQDWVRPGKTGWIVPARNVGALADALADALRRRAELRAMGAAARADIEQLGSEANLRLAGDRFFDIVNRQFNSSGASAGMENG